ncbi:LOW QUALITY PROTEIN: olfactory receptor 8K1-like [Trichechus inunguis]
MGQQNLTVLPEYILMGVTRHPELQFLLFGVFLIIYMITVVGNLGMIILTKVDSHLHTPVYFFIRYLAFIDLGNSTDCPKVLENFAVDQNTISYYACATRMAFLILFIISKMNHMEKHNHTAATEVTEFILMGITDNPRLQAPLFGIFIFIYLVTVIGNLGIIILTHLDSKLHTPMYFFLRHLSVTDLGYSTVIGPKMMVNFVAHKNTISFNLCATQLASFEIFIITELFILSAMAYDRYVAIYKPLLYVVIMAEKVRWLLVLTPYLYSTFVSLFLTIKLFKSSFCHSNIISYFYCDCLPLMSMLCSDTHELKLIILVFSGCNLLCSFLIVLVSYMFILVAILQTNTAEGRYKAFSTCGSHLTVVVVFYGTLLFIYLQPKSIPAFDIDKMASVFYTLVIPMLNPLIYSLRNKEVKDALKRTLSNRCKIPTLF